MDVMCFYNERHCFTVKKKTKKTSECLYLSINLFIYLVISFLLSTFPFLPSSFPHARKTIIYFSPIFSTIFLSPASPYLLLNNYPLGLLILMCWSRVYNVRSI